LPVKYRGKQNGDDIPAFGALEVLGAAAFGAHSGICCVQNFSSPLLPFRAAFPCFLDLPMASKTVEAPRRNMSDSSTASIDTSKRRW
jgi:hypothetical protein